MAAALLGLGAIVSAAAPAGAQATGAVSAPAPSLAETMRGKPLAEQVEAYGRAETDNQEQDCLASAVYFEARGESLEGQLAVAEVVLNRTRSGKYPTTICGVVEQPWQFSFVNATKRIPNANRSSEAWRKAVAIARIAQDQTAQQLSGGELWYHADYVAPSWGRRLARTQKVGLHIFYR
jgi:spore germination cell wall hydrolase CwlJ-like protein